MFQNKNYEKKFISTYPIKFVFYNEYICEKINRMNSRNMCLSRANDAHYNVHNNIHDIYTIFFFVKCDKSCFADMSIYNFFHQLYQSYVKKSALSTRAK